MPEEVRRIFAALSADSERGLLLSGPELRRQAARRRAAWRTGATAAVTAVLVVVAVGAGWAMTDARGKEPAPPPAAGSGLGAGPAVNSAPPSSASVSPSPSSPSSPSRPATPSSRPPTSEPTADPTPTPLPDEIAGQALLAQTDANATVTEMREPLGVPEFCPAAKFASRQQLAVSASRVSRYRKPDNPPPNGIPDDGVYNTVSVFRGDGAEDYLAELKRGAQVCADSQIRGLDAGFSLLYPLDVGDDSVLIQRQYEEVDADGKPLENGRYRDTFIAAVRIGSAVTVIDCRGYENGSSEVATARTLGRALAKRLKAWRG